MTVPKCRSGLTPTLVVGNDPRYIKTVCFDNFPFPDEDTGLTLALRDRINQLAESIDAHRQSQQTAHPGLTLTGMYNVMQCLRLDHTLTTAEQSIYNQGLVGVLKELHDELDTAVLQAYGWSDLNPATDSQELLTRLLTLNAQRATDEANGTIHWLRPDYQNPQNPLSNQERTMQVQQALEVDLPPNNQSEKESNTTSQTPWPSTLPKQIGTVAQLLTRATTALTLPQIEAAFQGRGPWKKALPPLLQSLEALGRAQRSETDGVTSWRA